MRAWHRLAGAALLAIGLAGAMGVPAVAREFPQLGPLEIRIYGANGDVRDFVATSTEDRRGAIALASQIAGALQGSGQPLEAAPGVPHYRIGVSHFGMSSMTPWARLSESSFIYYPGDAGDDFLMVEFSRGGAALERWMQPSPEVAALLQRHLDGLAPIGNDEAASNAGTGPWGLVIGAVLIAALSVMLFEDRRRWRLRNERRSAGKGTDQRS